MYCLPMQTRPSWANWFRAKTALLRGARVVVAGMHRQTDGCQRRSSADCKSILGVGIAAGAWPLWSYHVMTEGE